MSSRSHGHHHHGHESNSEKRAEAAEQAAFAQDNASHDEQSQLVKVGAYNLWEQAGKPDGQAAKERFWFEAEQELVTSQLRD